jgi:hypothetical protein
MEGNNPEYQLNRIAAMAANGWSTRKPKPVVSSSNQWSCYSSPQHEMSQLEHIANPVTDQYIWEQDEANQPRAPLSNNAETKEAADDTTILQSAEV